MYDNLIVTIGWTDRRKKLINCFRNFSDVITKYILGIVFSVFFILALVVKAMYSFDDSPYFTFNKWYDFVFIVLCGTGVFLMLKNREFIQNHINFKVMFCIYMVIAICYIYLVPLTPFSDMEHMYKAAVEIATGNVRNVYQDPYWTTFGVNIYLAFFYGIILIPLPKSIISIKVVNALMVYIFIYLISDIAKEYGVKYNKLLFIFLLFFSPLFLYINHIYFDIPFLFFEILALYIYKKQKNLIYMSIPLVFACFLRLNGFIILLAVLLSIVFKKEKIKKAKMMEMVFLCIIVFFIPTGVKKTIDMLYVPDVLPSYPALNQVYIGLNEKEFGFMDNDLSYERNWDDIINRVEDYGPTKLTKIIGKKTFWLWTQGTYQAERYAFGSDVSNELDKFEYKTVATKHLMSNDQIARKLINSFMRAQYLILFLGMVINILFSMYKKSDIESERELYYILIGTLLIMLIWELKSRYIIMCIPPMAIMAQLGFEHVLKLKEQI